jgi:hypothetical protein
MHLATRAAACLIAIILSGAVCGDMHKQPLTASYAGLRLSDFGWRNPGAEPATARSPNGRARSASQDESTSPMHDESALSRHDDSIIGAVWGDAPGAVVRF